MRQPVNCALGRHELKVLGMPFKTTHYTATSELVQVELLLNGIGHLITRGGELVHKGDSTTIWEVHPSARNPYYVLDITEERYRENFADMSWINRVIHMSSMAEQDGAFRVFAHLHEASYSEGQLNFFMEGPRYSLASYFKKNGFDRTTTARAQVIMTDAVRELTRVWKKNGMMVADLSLDNIYEDISDPTRACILTG